jgi:hypothetical protein
MIDAEMARKVTNTDAAATRGGPVQARHAAEARGALRVRRQVFAGRSVDY